MFYLGEGNQILIYFFLNNSRLPPGILKKGEGGNNNVQVWVGGL